MFAFSANIVLVAPGQSVETVTPYLFTSDPIALEKFKTYALDAAYTASYGNGANDPVEPKFRIFPLLSLSVQTF